VLFNLLFHGSEGSFRTGTQKGGHFEINKNLLRRFADAFTRPLARAMLRNGVIRVRLAFLGRDPQGRENPSCKLLM